MEASVLKFVIHIFLIFICLFPLSCGQETPAHKCTDPLGCVNIAPGAPVKIGVLQALSGKVAALGKEQIRGLELAMDYRQGKILGHPIALQKEDTGCTGEGGANSVLKILADPDVTAIFGTTCSGAARTASHAMSEAGLTMMSGNNSAPFLTSVGGKKAPDWHSGYFRTSNNEENAGKAAAMFAFKSLGIRRAATINDGDIYTRGLTGGFIKAFEELGGKIVLDTSVNKGDTIMLPVLTAVKNADAQLLFFPLFQPEGNYILFQAREIPAYKDIVLMSDGALIENEFIRDVGERGKGMFFVGPAAPKGPAVDAMAGAYKKKFNENPGNTYYLNAYDAAILLFNAVEKTAVRDSDDTIHIGRQALRDTLYATREFKGMTGKLACDKFGDCARPAFNILRLDNPDAGVEGLQTNIIFSFRPGS